MRSYTTRSPIRYFGAVLAVGVLLGGCPALPPTQLEPVSDVDFAYLKTITDMVMALNDARQGLRSVESVRDEYASDTIRVQVSSLPEVDLTYLLLTDLGQQKKTVLLPGTANLQNLVLDLRVDRVPDEELGISLHEGFRQTARAVRADLIPRLRPDYDVRLAGYSLGGCAATILGMYFTCDGVNVEQIITLGQPAVTDAAGAAAFANLPLLRIIAGDDGIPLARYEDYVQFGETVILLDGPYVVHLPADNPTVDEMTRQLIDTTDVVWLDHLSYRRRIDSKIGVDVFAVSFEEREAYLDKPPMLRF